MKRRILSVLLMLCLLCTLMPGAFADETVFSGSLSAYVYPPEGGPPRESAIKYWLDLNDTLYFEGEGDVDVSNDSFIRYSAWYQVSRYVRHIIIGDQITRIAPLMFNYLPNLEDVSIPESMRTIADYAFVDCGLKTVFLPKNVKDLGEKVFYACTQLESIEVDPANPYFCSVDGVLFTKDRTKLIQFPAGKTGDYVIPDSVTELGEYAFAYSRVKHVQLPPQLTEIAANAFEDCDLLEEITIPNSITAIGSSAFAGCEALKAVTIPSSVTAIGSSAFSSCSALAEITIPSSVTSIGSSAFYGCEKLEEITIPSSVTAIGGSAFCGCSALKSISVPAHVETIGSAAFASCSGLQSIEVAAENPAYTAVNGALFNKEKTQLMQVPAAENGVYQIPDGVETVDDGAFRGCAALTGIVVPASTTMLPNTYNCKSLETIEVDADNPNYASEDGVLLNGDKTELICCPQGKAGACIVPETVKTFQRDAFDGCEKLEKLVLPAGMEELPHLDYCYCKGLKSIDIAPNHPDYTSIDGVVYTKDQTELVRFPYGRGGDYTVPEGVVRIRSRAFLDAKKVESITLPASLLYIGDEMNFDSPFLSCNSLQSYHVAADNPNLSARDGVLYDHDFTTLISFPGAKGPSFTIPGNVEAVQAEAFNGCPNLTTITIVNPNLKRGYAAFEAWSLTDVYYCGTKLQWLNGPGVFYPGTQNHMLTNANVHFNAEPGEDAWIPGTKVPFTDVPEGKYYYEPILWAIHHNPQITNGTSPTTFSPEATCTRGQIVTFLWRAMGCPEPTGTTNPFVDVKASDYFYKAVLWAAEKNITNGTDASHFNPGGNCTRAHAVTFLWRAHEKPAAGTNNPFVDVPAGQYYTDAVLWAVSQGITNGIDATHFGPDSFCQRGQIVTFLYRDMK